MNEFENHVFSFPFCGVLCWPMKTWDCQCSIFLFFTSSSCNIFQVQVKVISLGDHCDKELVFSKLDKAINEGQWLVLNNCHLLDNWDDEVVLRLSQLTTSLKSNVVCTYRTYLINCCNTLVAHFILLITHFHTFQQIKA